MLPNTEWQWHISEIEHSAQNITSAISQASALIVKAIYSRRPIFVCGNGGSAADAMHLAAEMSVRFQLERRAIPCVVLGSSYATITAAGNDYGPETIFSRELSGYGDGCLIVFSTSMKSASILCAIEKAQEIGMDVIAFCGWNMPVDGVTYIRANNKSTQIVQECHGIMLHILMTAVEEKIHEMDAPSFHPV